MGTPRSASTSLNPIFSLRLRSRGALWCCLALRFLLAILVAHLLM
jgi:hypothetical protein